MARKPVLYYAVARAPYFRGGFDVIRVTSERRHQFSGVVEGNITSTTRATRDLVAKFPDADTANRAMQAYRDRWNAHSDLVEKAEKQVRIERNNREASALDAMRTVAFMKATEPDTPQTADKEV